jgi:hypothetical protein
MLVHAKGASNSRLSNVLRIFKAFDLKWIAEKWFESEDEWFCLWMEVYIIDFFGRRGLCNLTAGGESPPFGIGANNGMWGRPPKNKGIPMPEEQKEKIRLSMTGKSIGKGRKLSIEHRSKIAAANSNGRSPLIGAIPWNKGKKCPNLSLTMRNLR